MYDRVDLEAAILGVEWRRGLSSGNLGQVWGMAALRSWVGDEEGVSLQLEGS